MRRRHHPPSELPAVLLTILAAAAASALAAGTADCSAPPRRSAPSAANAAPAPVLSQRVEHLDVLTTEPMTAEAPGGFTWSPFESRPRYRVVHGWPVIPDNEVLAKVSAVDVDSHGDVFVLTRAGRAWPDSGPLDQMPITAPTVLVFDGRTGRLLERWGENVFALPHSITVDPADNVWVIHVARVAVHQPAGREDRR